MNLPVTVHVTVFIKIELTPVLLKQNCGEHYKLTGEYFSFLHSFTIFVFTFPHRMQPTQARQ